MKKILKIVLPFVTIAALFGVVYFFLIPNIRLGWKGNGAGKKEEFSANESIMSQVSSSTSTEISEIRIDEDKIYLDGDLCANENILKDKIIEIGAKKEFHFLYDNAIKGTYDKVEVVLSELEDALGIKVIEK